LADRPETPAPHISSNHSGSGAEWSAATFNETSGTQEMEMSNRTRGWSGRIGSAAVATIILALVVPTAALAQSADEERSSNGFELTGYLGAYLPLASLADSGDTLSAEFTTKVSFGLGLEYWFGSFGIAVNGTYSNPDLTIQILDPDDIGFSIPVNLGPSDLWMAAANVLWRPQLKGSSAVVRPYFGAGPAVVKVMYPSGGDLDIDIQDETRVAISLVGGAQVELSKGWFVRLDVRDYISKLDTEPFAETKTQHDLFASIGVGYAFH
jgi:opacity protein-like surface antigen